MKNQAAGDFDLFEQIYETALNPESFHQFIAAWDASFDTATESVMASRHLADLEQKGLARHFERAGQMFAATELGKPKIPTDFIRAQRTAALLTSFDGQIICSNDIAANAFGVAEGDLLSSLPLEAQSALRVTDAVAKMSEKTSSPNQAVAVSGVRKDNEKVFILIIEKLPAGEFQDLNKPTLLVRSTLTRWDDHIKSMLQAVFNLTPTELSILEMLNEGLKADEISEKRGRSLKTVRTQIKTINQKTRTNSQSELMRHISSLLILAGEIKGTLQNASLPPMEHTETRESTVSGIASSMIHLVDEGPRDAPSVLCFFPTTPPLQRSRFEKEIAKMGLRRVATFKPGSGQSTASTRPLSFEQQVENYQRVADHLALNDIIALGHCSGGLPALKFAQANPGRVRAVVLLDTGAPLQSEGQWETMPGSAKRTFFIAKHSPELLHTPHQVVAADFTSGAEGQRRVVDYFYADQGDDLALLRDPERYQLASEMIRYCLSDTAQLISDVSGWTQDWSELLAAVAEHTPIVFVHGNKNQQFPIEDINRLTEAHANIDVAEAEGAAQLTLITHADLVADVLRDILADRPNGR